MFERGGPAPRRLGASARREPANTERDTIHATRPSHHLRLGPPRSSGDQAAKFILETCRARGHGDPGRPRRGPAPAPRPDVQGISGRARPPRVLERLAGRIKAADAFIIVSGEYNHSIPPALSNLLDHFLEEYFWRPSAIVCYSAGAFGGVRAAMQLRAMLCELGTPSIPSLLPVPQRAGRLRRGRPPARRGVPQARGPVPRRAGVVRERLEGRPAAGVPYQAASQLGCARRAGPLLGEWVRRRPRPAGPAGQRVPRSSGPTPSTAGLGGRVEESGAVSSRSGTAAGPQPGNTAHAPHEARYGRLVSGRRLPVRTGLGRRSGSIVRIVGGLPA